MFRLYTAIFVIVLLAGDLHAQNHGNTPHTLFGWGEAPKPLVELGPITTDRPDFTEASSTVGKGVVQLETGYTFTTDNAANQVDTHSWGEPLLRVGVLANWLEFRIAAFPITQQTTGTTNRNDSGFEDLYLGFKIGLTPQDGWLPESAILPQMNVPAGATAFTDGIVLPGANYLVSWELTEKLSLAASTQFNSAVDGTDKLYTEWAQSVAISRSITDKFGMYSEWFGLFPDNANDALPEQYFNGGFTYLLNDNFQFDIRAGLGLNETSDDFFVGSGFSIRFP